MLWPKLGLKEGPKTVPSIASGFLAAWMISHSEHRFPALSVLQRKDVVNHCLEFGIMCVSAVGHPTVAACWPVVQSLHLMSHYSCLMTFAKIKFVKTYISLLCASHFQRKKKTTSKRSTDTLSSCQCMSVVSNVAFTQQRLWFLSQPTANIVNFEIFSAYAWVSGHAVQLQNDYRLQEARDIPHTHAHTYWNTIRRISPAID